jgi:hypothetical protein
MANMPTRLPKRGTNGAAATKTGRSLMVRTLQLPPEDDVDGIEDFEPESEENGVKDDEDKEKYPSCLRCDHKGMVCQFIVASGRGEVNMTCIRCARAGEKYCIKQTMIGPEGDSNNRLVYVDKGVVIDDVQEFEDLVAMYVGEQMLQAQPGVWICETEAKNFVLPRYRSYKPFRPLRTWKDVLPHDGNAYGRNGGDSDCHEEKGKE